LGKRHWSSIIFHLNLIFIGVLGLFLGRLAQVRIVPFAQPYRVFEIHTPFIALNFPFAKFANQLETLACWQDMFQADLDKLKIHKIKSSFNISGFL
jgi:hypothetical protein